MSTPGSGGADGLGGMREDEKFPEIPSLSADGAAQQSVKSGGAGEEEAEEDDGSWSDAEVERRVAERKNVKVDPYAVDDEEEEDDLGEVRTPVLHRLFLFSPIFLCNSRPGYDTVLQ